MFTSQPEDTNTPAFTSPTAETDSTATMVEESNSNADPAFVALGDNPSTTAVVIRRTKARWLGHILRMQPQRLVRRAVIEQFAGGQTGNILMDAPRGLDISELTALAFADKKQEWKRMVKALR